jgi:hypothetical protein
MLSSAAVSPHSHSPHPSDSSNRQNTLHKRKTPSIDKPPSRSISTANQLRVIEDFLGPPTSSRVGPKPTPTLSDPALQSLMALWPEDPRAPKSSGPPKTVRTTAKASKRPFASTSTLALDSPRPHPRPQPNPEVERILSRPTLLGRAAQPSARQIPTTVPSRDNLPFEEKRAMISQSRPPPLRVNTLSAATTRAPPSPPSVERPIGAKAAEIWYAERDRRRQERAVAEQLLRAQPRGADIISGSVSTLDLNQSTEQR